MADRFYGYQYGTTPRKLNPESSPYRKRYPQKEEPVKATNRNTSKNTKGNVSRERRINNKNTKNTEIPEKRVPEYKKKQVEITRKKVQKNNNSTNKVLSNEEVSTENIQNNKENKMSVKSRVKIIMFIFAGFSILFAISYQNSLISESFNRKEQYKKEMEALSKTNQQIEVSIENNLNLNNIEQVAKEKLGMQKLRNDQKIYVSLPKVDYVAPAAEQIVMEENLNFFQKLVRGFTKSIK